MSLHWRVLLQFFLNPDPTVLSAVRAHAASVSTNFIHDGSCLSCVHKKVVTIVTKFNVILINLIVRLVGIISIHQGIFCF